MSFSDTKQFYDEFSQNVMLKYFRQVNARIEGIKGLCDKFVFDGAKVLEVGCGVGILTKHLQRRAGQIISIDISETGLQIARAYANQPNIEFLLVNLLENSKPIETYGSFDVIIMADVIEHIRKADHKRLFEFFERILSPSGIVILTFPNSQHQLYLSEKEPEKLQIIDESVSIREILEATRLCPYQLNYFDADGKNKYIHLVLSADVEFSANALTNGQKVIRRIRNFFWAARNRRFLKKIQNRLVN